MFCNHMEGEDVGRVMVGCHNMERVQSACSTDREGCAVHLAFWLGWSKRVLIPQKTHKHPLLYPHQNTPCTGQPQPDTVKLPNCHVLWWDDDEGEEVSCVCNHGEGYSLTEEERKNMRANATHLTFEHHHSKTISVALICSSSLLPWPTTLPDLSDALRPDVTHALNRQSHLGAIGTTCAWNR